MGKQGVPSALVVGRLLAGLVLPAAGAQNTTLACLRMYRCSAPHPTRHKKKLRGNPMKRVLSVVCCIALCSVSGIAQKKKAAGGPAMSDQKFVDFAAQTDMVEANLGQLAGNVASSQPVKDYAQTVVADHQSDFSQLYSIAHQANLTMPSAIDTENNKTMIAPFEKLKGAAFDHRYVADMVAGHTKAIAIYKKEAADAENPSLKSYAEQALPTLQKHLDAAQELEKAKPAKKG